MKKSLILFATALALVLSSCMSDSQKALLGTWVRDFDNGNRVEYTFTEDGNFKVHFFVTETFSEQLDEETELPLVASYHYDLEGTYSFIIGVAELTYDNSKITSHFDGVELADPDNTPELETKFFNDEMKDDEKYLAEMKKIIEENDDIKKGDSETFTDVEINGNTLTGKCDGESFTMHRK